MNRFRPNCPLPIAAFAAILAVSSLPAAAGDWLAERTKGLAPVHGTYSNRQYGFRVAIPPGVAAWTTAPPNPDHGLVMVLGNHRTIDVEADYDAALYGSTQVLLERRLRAIPHGAVEIAPVRLGDSPAARATVTGPVPTTVVVQWRALPPNNAINYSAVLTTTIEGSAADLRTFARVLATYRHMLPER